MRRSLSLCLLFALCAASQGARYHFTPLPESSTARVTVKLEKGASREFRMPAWAPGDYELFNYGKVVDTIAFKRSGVDVVGTRSEKDSNLWIIEGGADEVTYTVKPSRGNFSPNLRVTATQAFVSGPGVFGWFEGDQRNKQRLGIALLPEGAKAYTTLDPIVGGESSVASFEAFDYDEMIDAPFVVGTGVRTKEFQVRGKPMRIIAYNRAENADLDSFVRVGTAAAQATFDLLGELPFQRYAFFCDFGGGGGGLEHLDSCRLGLGVGARGDQAAGFIFHEFVHCFNVKRIRPKMLGPFDYTKPALTGTIWWLEGVTDYYASVLMQRAGLESREQFMADMGSSLAGFLRNPNRLKVSADESSLKAWETRGSYGFGGVNYYEKGRIIGFLLDLAIRGRSNGKYSLDNVMRDLYHETKARQPGYGEDRIRDLCIKYGGPSLGPIYDVSARQRVELPVQEVATAAGMTWDGSRFLVDLRAPESLQKVAAHIPEPVEKPDESLFFAAAFALR